MHTLSRVLAAPDRESNPLGDYRPRRWTESKVTHHMA